MDYRSEYQFTIDEETEALHKNQIDKGNYIMGYYTRYSLTIADDYDGSIMKELRDKIPSACQAIFDSGNSMDSTKWYEHEKDLREFSLKHPKTLFTLHGEGEENSDIWDKYFMNGKMQEARAVLTTPPYDPKKLK
jgi:hypothetical protein